MENVKYKAPPLKYLCKFENIQQVKSIFLILKIKENLMLAKEKYYQMWEQLQHSLKNALYTCIVDIT